MPARNLVLIKASLVRKVPSSTPSIQARSPYPLRHSLESLFDCQARAREPSNSSKPLSAPPSLPACSCATGHDMKRPTRCLQLVHQVLHLLRILV